MALIPSIQLKRAVHAMAMAVGPVRRDDRRHVPMLFLVNVAIVISLAAV
jgi:hypothetical protein